MDGVSCFQQCSLACHKKCLETLAIQCGHKKLQGRLQLFGIDFAHSARNSPDGIPFIIKKCTSEIESRALDIKVNRTRGNCFRDVKIHTVIVIFDSSGMLDTVDTLKFARRVLISGYLPCERRQISCGEALSSL